LAHDIVHDFFLGDIDQLYALYALPLLVTAIQWLLFETAIFNGKSPSGKE
jgi:hypothetical protein